MIEFHIYILSADDSTLTCAGVVSAAILVNAPVTRPLCFNARGTSRVSGTVVVGEISTHEILIRLRRPHLPQAHYRNIMKMHSLCPFFSFDL